MSEYIKLIKLDDAISVCREKQIIEGDAVMGVRYPTPDEIINDLSDLPTIEVSEENELKFYYVESIDDYWIGQRLDNFYYAEWSDRLGFVWTHSRYLPWGEHVVAPDTLWKEHTYPSEPREIPFTEWIVGFMKKYGSEVSEGEWINKQEKYHMAECSNCKKLTMHEMWGDKLVYYDYCPNCGAKMKGEDDE